MAMLLFGTLILCFAASNAEIKQDLGGRWYVDSANGTIRGLEATVPGGIYSDLMNNNVIEDIYYGSNDVATRWVGNTDWNYYRTFTVTEDILDKRVVNVVFEGLDTIATVYVNDEVIGTSENMFRRYIFDVRDNLILGENNITVAFKSPIQEAQRLANESAYPIPPDCPSDVANGECHVNQLRKMQSSFSWDWGPAFPSMGIWKDVYLEAFDTAVIRYVQVDVRSRLSLQYDLWTVNLTVFLEGPNTGGALRFHTDPDNSSTVIDMLPGRTEINYQFSYHKDYVQAWWPNGYGAPNVYTLTTTFISANGNETSVLSQTFGYRSVELIQEPAPNGDGYDFYFKINNVTVSARGSNQIPLDVLPERGQDPALIERVLGDAHAVNINMLRVWGGGVYESDYFYDLADRLGIMIWQDFMFACSMYPATDEYLDNVREEVRHQVRRLSAHPSIVLWAGNNENELGLAQNWFNVNDNRDQYRADYVKLYVDTIQAEVDSLSNSNKVYLASSPSNGIGSIENNYIANDPQDPSSGDVHYYVDYVNSLSPTTYPIPRFASEYGYQSMPDLDTWRRYGGNDTDYSPNSDFVLHRQHKSGGQDANLDLIQQHFQLPPETHELYTEAFIYLSQVAQALSIKFESEYYRSFTGRYNDDGLGNNRGLLYWQINDVWVAPTWSSIDFTGKWKVLHYMLKDILARNLITTYLNNERGLEVYVLTELYYVLDQTVQGTINWEIYGWDSFEVRNADSYPVELVGGISYPAGVLPADDLLLNSSGCGDQETARFNCFFRFTFEISELDVSVETFAFTAEIKESNVLPAHIAVTSVEAVDDSGTVFDVTVETDHIALWVWLDSHEIRGTFSRNGFVLVQPQTILRFTAKEATTAEELQDILTVTGVNDAKYSA